MATSNVLEELNALDALAKAATPGPWTANTWSVECDGADGLPCDGGCTACDGEGELTQEAISDESGSVLAGIGTENLDGKPVGNHIQLYGLESFAKRDAAFIAAANPATVLALVAIARAAALLEELLAEQRAPDQQMALARLQYDALTEMRAALAKLRAAALPPERGTP